MSSLASSSRCSRHCHRLTMSPTTGRQVYRAIYDLDCQCRSRQRVNTHRTTHVIGCKYSEGVFGLRRAFTIAGAKRLVMSLWKVPDQQTQILMKDFYEAIQLGISCADALRQAQQKLKKAYLEPFYWGAFIHLGDP